MKIERAESKFQPVVITLESQEEVDILYCLTGSVYGNGSTRIFTDKVYYGLEPFVKSGEELFKDQITIRE